MFGTHLHVVLEELREILVVEVVEYFGDLYQGSEDDTQGVGIRGVLLGQIHRVVHEFRELGGKVVQDELDLLPEFLGFHLEGVLLENGRGRLEDA